MSREEIIEIFTMPFIGFVMMFIILGRCIEWIGYPFWLIANCIAGNGVTSISDYQEVMRNLAL